MIEIAAQMNITYFTKSNAVVSLFINLQQNDTMTGTCSEDNTTQEVNFVLHEGTPDQSMLTLIFTADDKAKQYGLTNMVYNFTLNEPDAQYQGPVNSSANNLEDDEDADYKIDSGASYKCLSSIKINFTEVNEPTVLVEAIVKDFRYQAFVAKDGFNSERRCGADFGTSDIVPIAVGCALAALVVIVLIAYLIGRRRSRQKGYQSV